MPTVFGEDTSHCGVLGDTSGIRAEFTARSPRGFVIWPIRCPLSIVERLVEGYRLIRRIPAQERRKWPRLPIAIPVFVRSKDEKGKELLEFATALNISAGGALIVVRRSPPALSQVILEIPSPPLTMGASVPRAARALRAKMLRVTHADGYHLLGVKFTRPLTAESASIKVTRRKVRSAV